MRKRLALLCVVVGAALGATAPAFDTVEPAQAHFEYCGHGVKYYAGGVLMARFEGHVGWIGLDKHMYTHWKSTPGGIWWIEHTYYRYC